MCKDFLLTRRSVKTYLDKEVSDELIESVVAAGLNAPSGMNKQLTKIVVIKDKDLINEIAKLNAGVMGMGRDPFYNAPVLIVVFASKETYTYKEDGSLVMGNLLNQAHLLGLGACWIHRAYESFETPEGKKLKEKFNLSDDYVGVGNCILGYTKDAPQDKERKPDRVIWVK